MLLPIIVIANSIGAQVASADAKRRREMGLPPPPPPPPPSIQDKMADAAIWILIMLPGIALSLVIGTSLFIILKIAFAREGISFP